MKLRGHLTKSIFLVSGVLAAAVSTIALGALLIWSSLSILNSDFYGRMSKVEPLRSVPQPSENSPLVRLVVHRLLPEENKAEVSVVIVLDRDVAVSSLTLNGSCLTVAVGDRTLLGIPTIQKLKLDCRADNNGRYFSGQVYAETPRFHLRTFASVDGYPFDHLTILPTMVVYDTDGLQVAAKYEVERAVAGRNMQISDRGGWDIRFVRVPLESLFVVASALVFLFLTILVGAKLFSAGVQLSGLQEVVAVAGYIIAASGFRDVLGLSRFGGISALEVVTFGLPLFLLSLAIVVSAARRLNMSMK